MAGLLVAHGIPAPQTTVVEQPSNFGGEEGAGVIPGYGDGLKLLSGQQQDYFGRHGQFQYADGVCRVEQAGQRTQIIEFGADEEGYYTELTLEDEVGRNNEDEKPTLATQNHLSNLFNMFALLNGNAPGGSNFGQFDNSLDAECRITYKATGKTEIITIKGKEDGGYRSTVKFATPHDTSDQFNRIAAGIQTKFRKTP